MKTMITILLFCGLSANASERNWYRIYLNVKIAKRTSFAYPLRPQIPMLRGATGLSESYIPRFERPKGAIFCRMEDYLTAKTKVWFKVGVK